MARRAKLRTEKRITQLEAAAASFQPAEPMRDLNRQEFREALEALRAAMGDREFQDRFPRLLPACVAKEAGQE